MLLMSSVSMGDIEKDRLSSGYFSASQSRLVYQPGFLLDVEHSAASSSSSKVPSGARWGGSRVSKTIESASGVIAGLFFTDMTVSSLMMLATAVPSLRASMVKG